MDRLTPAQRSENMSRIRGRNTSPEIHLQYRLKALGFRFRIHADDLPGTPDIVFRSRRAVIFLHGCFWHRHNCGLAYNPKTRRRFWSKKFQRNVERDKFVIRSLKADGWRVKVVWECELRDGDRLNRALKQFLRTKPPYSTRGLR